MNSDMIFSRITVSKYSPLGEIKDFLRLNDLDLDPRVTDIVVLHYRNDIIACAGLDGEIIKCVAISARFRGYGILLSLVTELINIAIEKGHTTLFVYTKSTNESLFRMCGFTSIVTIPNQMTLMENSRSRFSRYLHELAKKRQPGKTIGAIVMNANPCTNGHVHLIRYAAKNCDWLHLFLVNEDSSMFSFQERLALVRAATLDIANLTVHYGSKYMISRATFPAYFLKDRAIVERCYTQIDITLFRQYIAPVLGITHRFVGNEPVCPVTARYNQDMCRWLATPDLPFAPIVLVEIPRLEWHGTPISASHVRSLLQQNNFADIAPLVPDTTRRYLLRRQNRISTGPLSLTHTGIL